MTTTIDYALMAGASYRDTRVDMNRFPIPAGWNLVSRQPQDNTSGFEASSFGNATTLETSTEIVISYAGTYPKDLNGDMLANAGLAAGTGSAQLMQAVEYYLQVKAANPMAKITLTGHSLGGGLAALVGVFFGVEAHTFDQAPFAQTALFKAIDLYIALSDKLDSGGNRLYSAASLAPLSNFVEQQQAEINPTSFSFIPNAGLVTNINVQGEFLSGVPWNIPNRIGRTVLDINHGVTGLSGDDLHDQGLLTAFLLSDNFKQATFNLTNLLGMLFDKNLYGAETDTSDQNLLYKLLRHQIGVRDSATGAVVIAPDQMLDHFTADLQRIISAGGRTLSEVDLNKALTLFTLQSYHNQANGFTGELFESVGGGLKLDIDNVADSLGENKGYLQYFQSWFWPQVGGSDALLAYGSQLANADDWYIGGDRLIADAGETGRRAFLLGAGATDSLTGSTQADLLVGLGGADILSGGQGNDTLVGGDGLDTYLYRVGDGNDKIIDADKQGRILVASAAGNVYYDTTALIRDKDNPNLWINADGQVRMTHGGTWQLQIGSGSIDLGDTFTDGDYGIDLRDAPTEITPVNTVTGDQNTNKNDALYGTAGSDLIDGLTANDLVFGGAGDDKLLGGAGDDDIVGEADDDLVIGGAGHDRLGGNAGHDRLYAEDETPLADAIAAQDGTPTGQRGDQLTGSHGDDRLVGSAGNDILFGGKDDDIIIGGAGDDTIEGDLEVTWVYAAWDVQRQVTTSNGVTAYSRAYLGMEGFDSSQAGGDSIYAGGGADWVFAGAGDDWVDGGTGDDVVFGENGADILAGGAGDMSLYRLRHIDMACNRQCPAGIPKQARGHAGKRDPLTREASPGACVPARALGMETQVKDHNLITKLGAGGTANQAYWRLVA